VNAIKAPDTEHGHRIAEVLSTRRRPLRRHDRILNDFRLFEDELEFVSRKIHDIPKSPSTDERAADHRSSRGCSSV